jgi:hypothetical protein
MSFSRVGPNQTIERGQIRVAKSQRHRSRIINPDLASPADNLRTVEERGIERRCPQATHTKAFGFPASKASNQRVGSSDLSGRATLKICPFIQLRYSR